MEQSKINAVIIAGLLVVGAGAWAGPMMTAQTANELLVDMSQVQELSVAIGDKQGVNFDQFGLGFLKDDIFLDIDPTFLAPPQFFAGPIIELEAFTEQLVPPDTTGEQLTGGNANVFGNPVTLVEYIACNPAANNDDLNGATGTGPALLEDCQPALVDKLFVMAPNTVTNKKYRVQVAVCLDRNMANHENDPGGADNNPNNDTCDADPGTATGDKLEDGIIVMDLLLQIHGDHTQTIILDVGAIPPGLGNAVLVRFADNAGGNQNLNVWLGLKRVGSEGAFDFVNPAQFGGKAPSACIEFTILQSDGATAEQGATVIISVPPFFNEVNTTANDGTATFKLVPDGFLTVDLFPTNKPQFPLDRNVFVADHNKGPADSPNTDNDDPACNETKFTLPVGV